MPRSPRMAVTLVLLLLTCAAVAYALSGVHRNGAPNPAIEVDGGVMGGERDAGGEDDDAGAFPVSIARSRATQNDDGELTEPPSADDYACRRPDVPIPEEPGCASGMGYPSCRWQLPEEEVARRSYRIWRNTTPEHRWAQPGLVSLVMAVARDHAYRWPGEMVTIGDLDAPGPRHQTHDAGHDVDLYLENALMETNIGGGNYIDTYAGRPVRVVTLLRARVLDLAKNLATCSGGRLRIYYNDPEIITPFLAWFEGRGMVSDVGPAMLEHNRLHRFHFHMTVADGLEPLPIE